MRLLVPLLCLMSMSSCLLAAFVPLVIANSGNAEAHHREGAAREARLKALSAQQAAVIRQRYDATVGRTPEAAPVLELSPMPSLSPTSPPMVAIEPARRPLRSR